MAIVMAFFIVFLGIAITFALSSGKSKKVKYISWGLCIMLVGAPLSFSMGLTFAIIEGDGFAGLIMIYIYPIFLIIGIYLFIKGIFKKTVKD